jgi:hypothetical protein
MWRYGVNEEDNGSKRHILFTIISGFTDSWFELRI